MRRLRDKLIVIAATTGVVVPAAVLGVALSAMVTSVPGVAYATPQAVIRDCAQDGKLDQHYSLSDLKNAEKKLPTDVDEYTNCRDVINQAEVAGSGDKGSKAHGAAGGGGSGKNGGGGAGPSAKDVKALNRATGSDQGPPSLSLGGEKVTPGSGGVFKTAGAANSMPLPVLLSLIAVIALTAAGGFVALKRRFPEVIGAALRVFRR
jgi:hypothetical protein